MAPARSPVTLPAMNHREIPILETERLRLRPFREDDFDDYATLCADPEVNRHMLRGTFTREQSWRHMAFLAGHWQFRGYGMWAVEEKETGAFAGMTGFSNPAGWPGFELSWTLAPRFWGRGYATEGARAALAWAFTVLKRDRVISLIQPENHASIRVAERLGESLQGRTEMLGKDLLVYGIDRESFLVMVRSAAPG
ncbi:MAG TPA: GNAT family N-acetyltransferase [Thermoanaerobaculia bacterium]|nr:GNAT family N-acetyltransferase [Thermoanaerobaculia bacterium]